MITLHDFRDLTRHLPPDSLIGISFDEDEGENVITLREPGSKGCETIITCGTLDAYEPPTPKKDAD